MNNITDACWLEVVQGRRMAPARRRQPRAYPPGLAA